jgi:nucleotide-binding universal stress UspA family protein
LISHAVVEETLMVKLLVPTDGSPASMRAIRHVVGTVPTECNPEVHLLNVQEPIDAWEVRHFLSEEEVAAMQQQRAEEAVREPREALEQAGLPYRVHVGIGPVAETIVQYAGDLECQQIVMATQGMGALKGLLLGSVVTKVLHLADVPVTLVK